MKRSSKAVLVALLGLVVLAWLLAANPFNLFVRRSEHFSMDKFKSVEPGTGIEDAVAILGDPIIVRRSAGLVCENCTAYYFLGDPARWLLSYQEAWLLVDDEGRVLTVTVNSEP